MYTVSIVQIRTMTNIKNLKHFPRSDETVEPLAAKPTQVRLPVRVEQAIRRLNNHKSPWLRRVITEAAQRELMGNVTDVSNASQSPGVAQSGLLITGNPAVKDVSPPGPGSEKPKRGRKPKGENHANP
jgi:hypothetical protein